MFEDRAPSKEDLKKLAKTLMGLLFSVILMFVLLYLVQIAIDEKDKTGVKKQPVEITFKDGDVIFQSLDNELNRRIAAITESPITHCGIIVVKEDQVWVLEASDYVVLTPIEEWIGRDAKHRFILSRPVNMGSEAIAKVIAEGKSFMGRPYDYQFDWDDEYLYCSELVYKAYKRGAGVELCPFVALGSLNYQGHEDYIKDLMKGSLPLDRKLITPVDLYRSESLEEVFVHD